jgi:CheY-like chemotaxis protein/HPt (histidine-containing phosphotransfer) domain-containing protein
MRLLRWFDAYVTKPVRIPEFYEGVSSVLGGSLDLPSADEDTAGLAATSEEKARRRAGKRVLVAEDHFVNQQLFRTILEKMGLNVIVANNGREAVERVKNEAIDLVFMDVHMPEMNGYEASQHIRKLDGDLPIIAVTANATPEERGRCTDAGMNDYLSKPFKNKDLVPLVDQYLPLADTDHGEGAASQQATPFKATQTTTPPPPHVEAQEEEKDLGELESLEQDEADEEGEGAQVAKLLPEGESGSDGRAVFDYDSAVQAFMGKSEVVNRVVNRFIEHTGKQLGQLEALLEDGELSQAQTIAHGIKGGAWNLSAERLGDAAFEVEKATREERSEDARRDLNALNEEFVVFKSACEENPEL